MSEYGTLIIFAHVLSMRYAPGNNATPAGYLPIHRKTVVKRITNITRLDAQELVNIHVNQLPESSRRDYLYQWQPDSEYLDYSTAHH